MSLADIALPGRTRRPGLAWFLAPLFLLGVWLAAGPHHARAHHHPVSVGVAADH